MYCLNELSLYPCCSSQLREFEGYWGDVFAVPSYYFRASCSEEYNFKNPKTHALASPTDASSSCSTGTPARAILLDSGATHHVVGDAGILTDLHDPPAGSTVIVADGFQLPVEKAGVIQTPDIRIPDVYFVPGLQVNLVSVRQLAKIKVVTTFYENHAELWREGEQVGGAIADNDTSLYRLCFFKPSA